jgi:hypothetical protein
MRPLAAVERFFERLFERPSARLFHAPLQPIQVQRRLERAMEAGRVDSGDRVYVSNRYVVTLNPADAEAFDVIHARVEDDLAEALHARARNRGYRLIARPTVRLRVSGMVARGDIEVDAEALDRRQLKRIDGHLDRPPGRTVSGASPQPDRSAPAPGMHLAPVVPARIVTAGNGGSAAAGAFAGTSPGVAVAPIGRQPSSDLAMPLQPGLNLAVAAKTAVDAGRPATPPTGAFVRVSGDGAPRATGEKRTIATVEVRTSGRLVTTRAFEGDTLRVGRARDNQLVLADERVSRYHGQLLSRRGVLVYADLDSTNGSFLNGAKVHEIVLGSGDVVRLGNSTLTILSHS